MNDCGAPVKTGAPQSLFSPGYRPLRTLKGAAGEPGPVPDFKC